MSGQGRKASLEAWLLQVWYKGHRPGFPVSFCLALLEYVYGALRLLSRQNKKTRASKTTTTPPLLVIGNLIAGGAGKTPLVMAICKHLKQSGKTVGIVSRGYGRSGNAVTLLRPGQGQAKALEVGDEPLFLLEQTGCPVAVGSARSEAVRTLLNEYPNLNLIVSDDGLQHHRMQRQIEWVVFDARGKGNGRLLPAGPLREPLGRLKSVDAIIASNMTPERLANLLAIPAENNWYTVEVDVLGFRNLASGQFLGTQEALSEWKTQRLAFFTGLANPDKLFGALLEKGLKPERTLALPDHYAYPGDFCDQFDEQVLITSGKDAVKLGNTNPKLWVAEIDVKLPPALIQTLEEALGPTTD